MRRPSRRPAYATVWLKAHGSAENRYAADLRRFFRTQYEGIVKAVEASEGNWKPEAVFRTAAWNDDLIRLSQPNLARAAMVGAGLAQIQAGVAKARKDALQDLLITLPQNILGGIRSVLEDTFAQDYWGGINETTAFRLRLAFEESLANGYSLREQVAAIGRFVGPETYRGRAVMIARTETTSALNAGGYVVAQELFNEGLATGLKWLATVDDATRLSHMLANGQKIPAGGEFELLNKKTGIVERAPYPGWHKLSMANRANCRCTTLTVTVDRVPSRLPVVDLELVGAV